ATPPGGHTIDVTGTNQAGEPVDVTQPIYVPVSDTDADGDGIPDSSDSCPYAANSGIDSDHDGIDDVCDPLIGQPPGGSGSTNNPSSPGPSGPVAPASSSAGPTDAPSLKEPSLTLVAEFPDNYSGSSNTAKPSITR